MNTGLLFALSVLFDGPRATGLSAPEAVVAAERAFAAEAARSGTRAAFLAFLLPEAVVFTPKPENGWGVQRAQKEDGSRLSWEPERVVVAASGDFALSTGPWAWRPAGAEPPQATGHFLSLWVLRDGRWRVLLDVGTPHPPRLAGALMAQKLAVPDRPAAPSERERAWEAFDRAAASNPREAFRTWGAEDLRLYRRGAFPEKGVIPTNAGEPVAWEPLGLQVASSEDLAFRWGLRRSKAATASAVQVWRRDARGWVLAMDVELPWPNPNPVAQGS